MEVKAIESDCNQEGARGLRNVSQDDANGQEVQPEPFAPQFWGTKQSFIRYLCYSSILSQTPTLGAETITNCNS